MRTGKSVLDSVTTILVLCCYRFHSHLYLCTVTYCALRFHYVLIVIGSSDSFLFLCYSWKRNLKVRVIYFFILQKTHTNQCAVIFRSNSLWLLIHLSGASRKNVQRVFSVVRQKTYAQSPSSLQDLLLGDLSSLMLVIVGLEGYCCTWSHSVTQTHTVELLWTRNRPVSENSTWQYATLLRDRHSCPRRYSNPQSQKASGRRQTP
jgi:hypothetical protein